MNGPRESRRRERERERESGDVQLSIWQIVLVLLSEMKAPPPGRGRMACDLSPPKYIYIPTIY